MVFERMQKALSLPYEVLVFCENLEPMQLVHGGIRAPSRGLVPATPREPGGRSDGQPAPGLVL